MGRKAVGPVCCVMHVKEPRTLIVKEKGLAPVFLDSRLEHPAGWMCARYKSYHHPQTATSLTIQHVLSFMTSAYKTNILYMYMYIVHVLIIWETSKHRVELFSW